MCLLTNNLYFNSKLCVHSAGCSSVYQYIMTSLLDVLTGAELPTFDHTPPCLVTPDSDTDKFITKQKNFLDSRCLMA